MRCRLSNEAQGLAKTPLVNAINASFVRSKATQIMRTILHPHTHCLVQPHPSNADIYILLLLVVIGDSPVAMSY